MNTRTRKTIRNTTISVVILLVLFVAAGVLYVLFADQTPAPRPKTKASSTSTGDDLPKPEAPAADAKEFAAVEVVTTPVQQGQNSSVEVATNATSVCKISVVYNGVPSTDSGLTPKTADAYGNVTWAWTIGNTVAVGTWPISVTCVYHGRSAVVDTSVQVIK